MSPGLTQYQAHILVVEDNVDTCETLSAFLQHFGFTCDIVHSGLEALDVFDSDKYDLVLLDRLLPGLEGTKVCQHIRNISMVPIIMLTAKVAPQDLVDGLEAGADEYVKKPFSNMELVARIKAHLRRTNTKEANQTFVDIGPYRLDEKQQLIQVKNQTLKLTKTEYLLLRKLLLQPNSLLSREQLFVAVFGYNSDSSDRTVDVHLHNVRKKVLGTGIEEHGITAVYGMGYKLEIQ